MRRRCRAREAVFSGVQSPTNGLKRRTSISSSQALRRIPGPVSYSFCILWTMQGGRRTAPDVRIKRVVLVVAGLMLLRRECTALPLVAIGKRAIFLT